MVAWRWRAGCVLVMLEGPGEMRQIERHERISEDQRTRGRRKNVVDAIGRYGKRCGIQEPAARGRMEDGGRSFVWVPWVGGMYEYCVMLWWSVVVCGGLWSGLAGWGDCLEGATQTRKLVVVLFGPSRFVDALEASENGSPPLSVAGTGLDNPRVG